MKPWRVNSAAPSDFKRNDTPPQSTSLPAATAVRCAAGVGAVTLALGFAEACLHVEHRPIPLPFAARFALYNAAPSAVWSSVSAQQVAAVANLPLDRLVTPAATLRGAPNLERQRAKRGVAIRTVRSLRYAVASYGIVWAAWCWHEARTRGERSDPREDSVSPACDVPAGRVERVVRLAPSGSSLSKATATKQGDHVRHVPWHRGDAIDWSTVGLEEARRVIACTGSGNTNNSARADGDELVSPLKVLELEIDHTHDGDHELLVAKRAAAGANGSVRTVAVVDASASPAWRAQSHGVDVYFYALSGIVRFLLEHLDADDVNARLVLVAGDASLEEESAATQEKAVIRNVRRALVHRHGIPVSVGMQHVVSRDDEEEEEEQEQVHRDRSPPPVTVVFASTLDGAAKQLARLDGLVPIQRTLVVIDESLCAATTDALPPSLAMSAGVLSVADLTDAVLQRVREQLRAGASAEAIQLSLFDAFGEQSALLRRADAASDVTRFI